MLYANAPTTLPLERRSEAWPTRYCNNVHFIASGYAAEGALAAGETVGATGRAQMEVLYLLPVVCKKHSNDSSPAKLASRAAPAALSMLGQHNDKAIARCSRLPEHNLVHTMLNAMRNVAQAGHVGCVNRAL